MDKGRKKRQVFYIALTFTVLAVIYFMPAEVLGEVLPEAAVRFRIAWPVAALAAFGAYLGIGWRFVLAFVLSCTGDAMGAAGSFIGQMGYFAAAHGMLIWEFAVRIWKYGRCVSATGMPEKRRSATNGFWASPVWKTIVCLSVAAALAFAFILIIPQAPAGTLRIGCGVYAVLIGTMFGLSLMQRSPLFAVGAALFLISDMILSWNRFVGPVTASGWMIMVPYYLGQLMLWLGAATSKGPDGETGSPAARQKK